METIPKADCQHIGFIKRTHGVHGEVVLEYEQEFVNSMAEPKRFFIELDGLLVPFFISSDGFRYKSGKTAILSFLWVDNETYAKRLVGKTVFLFKSEIIEPPGKEFGLNEFENFLLVDATLGEIGIIKQVDDFSGNVVFTVFHENNEVLIPFSEELVIKIERKKQIITMNLPEGML